MQTSGPMQAFNVEFYVHSVHHLPKADRFGSIDPYVVVEIVNGAKEVFHREKTPVIKKNYDPVFNHVFNAKSVPKSGSYLHFEVWDWDALKPNEKVADAFVEFYPGVAVRNHVVKLNLMKGYKAHDNMESTVTISFASILDFNSLSRQVQLWPGQLTDTSTRAIYLPLPYSTDFFPINGTYLEIHYDKNDTVIDLFMLETLPLHKDNVIVGFGLKPDFTNPIETYRLKRKTSDVPFKKGFLDIYAETKLDDLDLFTPFHNIIVYSALVKKIWTSDVDALCSSHGWVGSLDYEGAKRMLQNVVCNDQFETVDMLTQYGSLIIEWDEDGVDFSFGLFDEYYQQNMVSDIRHSNQMKRNHKVWFTPRPIVGSEKLLRMAAELDDMPEPCYLNQIEVSVDQHTDFKTVDLLQLLPLLRVDQ